jgi:glycosyltransferase involved in cell wall biosynthesis
LIYDIYPDVLVEYGIFGKKSLVIKIWGKLNTRLYKKADKVYTISEGMKRRIGKYIPDGKIDVVPLWANEGQLKPILKENNKFIKANGLEDKFIVLYSGNLGRTHDLETLIYAAEKIKRDDILFLIIGGGDKKSKLQEMIRDNEISNVIMKPWQPIEMLPYTLNSADLGVVTLGSGASGLSLPSKTFNYISVGVPLLCIAEKTSELAKLVQNYEVGGTFRPDEIDEIIEFILAYADNKEQYNTVRDNVYKASRDFSKENAKKFVHYL